MPRLPYPQLLPGGLEGQLRRLPRWGLLVE